MIITKCPICGSENLEYSQNIFCICNACSHVFKNETVDSDIYRNYVSSAHMKRTPKHVENCNRAVNGRFKLFSIFAKKGKTLEVGCGHKYFLDKLKENGYEPEGTELSEALIREISHKIWYGNPSEIEELSVYSNICAFHVLEHMNEPIKEIRCLVEHLEEDGIFMLELPTLIMFGKELNMKGCYAREHVQYFTQTSLMEMFNICNLIPIIQINSWQGNSCVTTVCAVKKGKYVEKMKEKCIKYLYPDEI